MSWGVAWGVNHPQATGDVNELPVGENFSYLKRRIVPIWYPSENSPRGCRSIARGGRRPARMRRPLRALQRL